MNLKYIENTSIPAGEFKIYKQSKLITKTRKQIKETNIVNSLRGGHARDQL